MKEYKVGDIVNVHHRGIILGNIKIELIKGCDFVYYYENEFIISKIDNIKDAKQGVFIPKKGEKYYYNDSYGCMYHQLFEGTRSDDHRLNTGNCFRTKEDVEFHAFKLKMEQKMRIAFKDYPVDWSNGDSKYFIVYDLTTNAMDIDFAYKFKTYNIYCNNEEVVKQFIEENEEDLIKYFKGV